MSRSRWHWWIDAVRCWTTESNPTKPPKKNKEEEKIEKKINVESEMEFQRELIWLRESREWSFRILAPKIPSERNKKKWEKKMTEGKMAPIDYGGHFFFFFFFLIQPSWRVVDCGSKMSGPRVTWTLKIRLNWLFSGVEVALAWTHPCLECENAVQI